MTPSEYRVFIKAAENAAKELALKETSEEAKENGGDGVDTTTPISTVDDDNDETKK